ncbi:MAG: hypothetical protein ACREJR_01190, partial [Candidatus Rokuibacteriota bacterium]
PVSAEALLEAGNELVRAVHRGYPGILLRAVGSFVMDVPDLEQTFELDFGRRHFRRLDGRRPDWDVRVNSQPLLFAFQTTYGMQTLSISGRFWLRRKHRPFLLLRVLMALRNAEIYLRPRHLLERRFRQFAWQNRTRLRHQAFGWFGFLRTLLPDSPEGPARKPEEPSPT